MTPTLTRIDPALPICWEDQQTLRFGFDRVEASLPSPSPAAQRLVAELVTGVRSDRLSGTLRRIGASREDWSRVTDVLAAILVVSRVSPPSAPNGRAKPPPARALRVGVIAPGRGGAAAAPLLDAFARAGFEAEPFSPAAPGCELVVAVERFLEPHGPERLEAAGLPQLAVRFGDRALSVGPLVPGEGGPCLSCATLHDVDRDPALPALAAQLLGEIPAAETVAGIEAAAGLAVLMVRHWRAGSEMPARTRLRVPVREGLPSPEVLSERVEPHPECGCGLTASAARLPR